MLKERIPLIVLPKKYMENYNKLCNIINISIACINEKGDLTVLYVGKCDLKSCSNYTEEICTCSLCCTDVYPTFGLSDEESKVWIHPSKGTKVYNYYKTNELPSVNICENNELFSLLNIGEIDKHAILQSPSSSDGYGTGSTDLEMPNIESPHENNSDNTAKAVSHNPAKGTDVYNYCILKELPSNNIYEHEEEQFPLFEENGYSPLRNGKKRAILQSPSSSDGYGTGSTDLESPDVESSVENNSHNTAKANNEALIQLMSPKSTRKPKKTIVYVKNNENEAITIQKMTVSERETICSSYVKRKKDTILTENNSEPSQKKYQCNSCQDIFDDLATFKEHVVKNHTKSSKNTNQGITVPGKGYKCEECQKYLKTAEKLEIHRAGHGNPEVECQKCLVVFASKASLQNHQKIHNRKYPCKLCTKSWNSKRDIQNHYKKVHQSFMCKVCDHLSASSSDDEKHKKAHKSDEARSKVAPPTFELSEIDISKSMNDFNIMNPSIGILTESVLEEEISKILEENKSNDKNFGLFDPVSAPETTKSNFRKVPRRTKKDTNKTCNECQKQFDRSSDLKRHLIEHVIKKVLRTNPVNENGTLLLKCDICPEIFSAIDMYKAHLREHARLTTYKCSLCGKSFSDSSNFAKHKKVHGYDSLHCNICRRKYNTKKMLDQHMEYHKNIVPYVCDRCEEVFYFESTLNKHIKLTHKVGGKQCYRCKFCQKIYRSLKDRWDHEWKVHKVRKAVVDCHLCSSKFRKQLELKRHLLKEHK